MKIFIFTRARIHHALTRDRSGYYRININGGWVYCDMTAIANAFSPCNEISGNSGAGGVWKRIAGFNITAGGDCPSPWVKSSFNDVSFCRPASNNSGCYSVNYTTNEIGYQRVCGRASGYQKGSTDGFHQYISMRTQNMIDDIDSYYVDGLSITHGRSPRNHIWTYGVGATESANNRPNNCPCATAGGREAPDFVRPNYYCESGAGSSLDSGTYYLSDVLWDGAGCPNDDGCCSNPNLPWFYRQLNVTTQDDIEVRICIDEEFNNEAVLITNLELYIQ